MRNSLLRALLLTAVIAPNAFAQEHEAKGSLLTPSGGLMVWTLLIFVILFFILTKFAFGPLTAAVAAREKALEDAIAAANRDRDEAARLLEEQRRQIEAARNDAQRIIAEGRSTGEKMRADMLEQTRVQQNELLDRARREIEGEKVRAIAELRREAVDLAIAGAGKVIERNLDDDSNRRLVESFLAGLGPGTAKR